MKHEWKSDGAEIEEALGQHITITLFSGEKTRLSNRDVTITYDSDSGQLTLDYMKFDESHVGDFNGWEFAWIPFHFATQEKAIDFMKLFVVKDGDIYKQEKKYLFGLVKRTIWCVKPKWYVKKEGKKVKSILYVKDTFKIIDKR